MRKSKCDACRKGACNVFWQAESLGGGTLGEDAVIWAIILAVVVVFVLSMSLIMPL